MAKNDRFEKVYSQGTLTVTQIWVDRETKAGNVDKVYVRLDQNKLHWVKGDETGSVDIW